MKSLFPAAILLTFFLTQPLLAAPVPALQLLEGNGLVTLQNEYLQVSFDLNRSVITGLKADFSGGGAYGVNLLAADGIRLEGVGTDGSPVLPPAGQPTAYRVVERTPSRLTVQFPQITLPGGAESDWTLTLERGNRSFRLRTTTHIPGGSATVRLRFYLNQWFMSGLFGRGVVAYVAGQNQRLTSASLLSAFYTMDRQNGSVAIVPDPANGIQGSSVLSGNGRFGVGLDQILTGPMTTMDGWMPLPDEQHTARADNLATVRVASYLVYPNNLPFPTHRLAAGPNMDVEDLDAYYRAVYGSAAGVLGSYGTPGSAYPTLAVPNRSYGDLYNFFDPDAWSTVATLSYSGDPDLQAEARKALEKSEAAMRSDGLLPHHFSSAGPTYLAISGAAQTGPNIFWTLAAIDYAMGTGDETWLKAHYPDLKRATEWVLSHYDPQRKLLNVGGPLFIDVFIRDHYTLDTNAMMLRLLHLLPAVARFCGDAAGAVRYTALEKDLRAGIRQGLWDGKDHFVTERQADWTIRDRVDYDGNYAALAFGALDNPEEQAALLKRMDGGPHTHPGGRGTWPSEIRYDAADCYNGNTGDSDVAFARIWWLDMLAHCRVGDLQTFRTLLSNVRSDVRANTWLTERYDAQGHLVRSPYYHEYPEILAMLTREQLYGIDVKIDVVTIHPFGLDHYDFHVGDLIVSYSRDRVKVHVPGKSLRNFEITGLAPSASYSLSTGHPIRTDLHGDAVFRGLAGQDIVIQRADGPH